MKIARKNKAINAAFSTLQEISRSKEERMRYESRLKYQRDVWAFEEAAEQKGRAEERELIFNFLQREGYDINAVRNKFQRELA